MQAEADSKISESEWEVMRVVWTLNKVTSKEIIEILQQKKDWKPATTKTFIGRLVKKGMLEAEVDGKHYLYSAKISEAESIRTGLGGIFNNICHKEVGKTIANLITQVTLSHTDIDLLEKVIEMKKNEAVDEVVCNCVPGQCKCKGA